MLASKKLELMGQAVFEIIQFLCDYFGTKQLGTTSSLLQHVGLSKSSSRYFSKDYKFTSPRKVARFPVPDMIYLLLNGP